MFLLWKNGSLGGGVPVERMILVDEGDSWDPIVVDNLGGRESLCMFENFRRGREPIASGDSWSRPERPWRYGGP